MIRVVDLFLSLFKKECDHRFDAAIVRDLNVDPRCTKCGYYFSKISMSGNYEFKMINEKEYGLIKVRRKALR